MKYLWMTVLMMGLITVTAAAPAAAPFAEGERIDFAIKKMGLKAGNASLVFEGEAVADGRNALKIVFTADALNVYDQETIYVDPVDFLPIRVERDLDIWGKKEKIVEHYLRDKGEVLIVKTVKGQVSEQTIKKQGRIENIYGFIYRYRLRGDFKIGDRLKVPVPTKDLVLELLKKEQIRAGGEKHQAYYMKSDPSQYRLWFSDRPSRLPLRIDGAVGFGKTSMVMESYSLSE